MMISTASAAAAVGLLLCAGSLQVIHAVSKPQTRRPLAHRIRPEDDIVEHLRQEHLNGVLRPSFTLVGEWQKDLLAADFDSAPSTFEINVVEANPSITDETIVTIQDGWSFPVADLNMNLHLLVSADHELGDFALLTVDTSTNQVQGMVKRNGEGLVKVQQMAGEVTVVTAEEEFVPDVKWTCGVDETFANNQGSRRHLRHAHAHGHHAHQPHGHSHPNDHADEDLDDFFHADEDAHDLLHHALEDAHDHSHGDHENFFSKIDLLGDAADDIGVSFGKRRRADFSPQGYTHEVNLYIEIDNTLVDTHAGMTPALAYVNALITAASAIYEQEIDTHLNVAEIVLTTIYDSFTTTSSALAHMLTTHAGNARFGNDVGGIDLHHALLGKFMGGGLAYVAKVCDPEYGFGVSTGIIGNMANVNIGQTYADIYAFAHELGHNFGAMHTHDASKNPVVDTCGTSCPADFGTDKGTIMSSCHECTGGVSNILMTFGGSWDGDIDRTDIDNWIEHPNIGDTISTDAKRVPYGMHEHILSRGTCVDSVSISGLGARISRGLTTTADPLATPAPSADPLTPAPSADPTPAPSTDPLTLAPSTAPTTKSPTPSPTLNPIIVGESATDAVTTTVVAQVTLPIAGIPCGESAAEKKALDKTLTETITKIITKTLKDTQTLDEVKIVSTGCERRRFLLGRRHLADTTNIVTDIAVSETTTVAAGNGDTVDTAALGSAIADQVTSTVNANVASGALITALEEQAVANGVDVGENVTAGTATTTVTSTKSKTVTTKADWYPDWTGHSGTCLANFNGGAPQYMERGGYFEGSIQACCTRYFDYAYTKCTGDDADAIGFYPAFDGSTKSMCVNNTKVPDYMRATPSAWIYPDFASCCKKHYNWAYNTCVVASDTDGTSAALGTSKWYVDHGKRVCKQDCIGSGSCGGLATAWVTLYSTASECCNTKLSWIGSSTCIKDSSK